MKKLCLVIIAVNYVLLSCLSWANDGLTYELTCKNIESVCISEIENGHYSVYVKLNKKGRKTFSSLTAENIGQKMDVTFCGQVLSSAIIRGKIESGIISIGYLNSIEKLTNIIKELL